MFRCHPGGGWAAPHRRPGRRRGRSGSGRRNGGLWEEDEAAAFYRSPREEERSLILGPADGAGMRVAASSGRRREDAADLRDPGRRRGSPEV